MVLRGGDGRGGAATMATPVAARPDLLAGEDLPPEPRQKRSREKRERLKAAALAQFGEKGFEASGIDEIARSAGLAVGGFYLHYRSKRQLLLALMNELLDRLSRMDLRPSGGGRDVRGALRDLLSRAFSQDLRYLGAYRAWQEAMLSDAELARKNAEIHTWTSQRVLAVFQWLAQQPGAREGVDLEAMARVMDSFFWSLLGQAVTMQAAELDEWIDTSVHLIYHGLFRDRVSKRRTEHGPAADEHG